VLEDNDPRWKA
jgi:hypothetical protein